MKIAALIAGILLGLLFVMSAVTVLFKLAPMLLGIAALALFLLWVERDSWKAIVVRA